VQSARYMANPNCIHKSSRLYWLDDTFWKSFQKALFKSEKLWVIKSVYTEWSFRTVFLRNWIVVLFVEFSSSIAIWFDGRRNWINSLGRL